MALLHGAGRHSDCVWSVAFSPHDPYLLASGSADETIKLWNVKSRRLVHTFDGAHSDSVWSVAFSPHDPSLLASGSDDKTIKLWNVKSRRLVHTFDGAHSNGVASVVFSPHDPSLLASTSWDKTIKLWDVKSRRLVHTFDGAHSNGVASVVFSPHDPSLLASSSWDKTIKLWDVKSRRLVHTFDGAHSDYVRSVAFSPHDPSLLASSSWDKTIKLWDVKSRRLVHTFGGAHSDSVRSVAFSPHDPSLLASGSRDKTIKLWDVKSRRLVHTFGGAHSDSVWSVAFSPHDPSLLASGSIDKTIKLWDVSNFITPRTPPFYDVLAEAEQRSFSSYTTLEELAPHVEGVVELILFYTAAKAALRHGNIDVEERNKFVHDALEAATTKFRVDDEGHVAAALLLVIEKAKADGILDKHEARQLDRQAEKASTYADARFVSVLDRLSQIDRRLDNHDAQIWAAHERIDNVHAYAKEIDGSLHKFKQQYRKQLKRKAAASTISAIVGVFTLGTASGLVTAIEDVSRSIFDKIVDFGDVKHVLKAVETSSNSDPGQGAVALAEGKLEEWVDKPLEDAVKDEIIPRNLVQVAALVQTCVLLEQATEDSEPGGVNPTDLVDDPARPPPPPTAVPTDGVPAFAELKARLELDESVKEIMVDDTFWLAFQDFFDIDFLDIGDSAQEFCRKRIDRNGNGTTSPLEWQVFFKAWSRGGMTMEEYLKNKL